MKKKILFISILLLFIILLFINNNVFASTVIPQNVIDYATDLNGGVDNIVILKDTINNLYVIPYVQGDDAINQLEQGRNWVYHESYISLISPGWYEIKVYAYDIESSTFYMANSEYLVNKTMINLNENVSIVYSSYDVITYSTGDTFFHKTPVTLAQALEMNNPMEIFKTQMKNVVVSLVVFLVGLIAFLKAWAWLKTQLHKA